MAELSVWGILIILLAICFLTDGFQPEKGENTLSNNMDKMLLIQNLLPKVSMHTKTTGKHESLGSKQDVQGRHSSLNLNHPSRNYDHGGPTHVPSGYDLPPYGGASVHAVPAYSDSTHDRRSYRFPVHSVSEHGQTFNGVSGFGDSSYGSVSGHGQNFGASGHGGPPYDAQGFVSANDGYAPTRYNKFSNNVPAFAVKRPPVYLQPRDEAYDRNRILPQDPRYRRLPRKSGFDARVHSAGKPTQAINLQNAAGSKYEKPESQELIGLGRIENPSKLHRNPQLGQNRDANPRREGPPTFSGASRTIILEKSPPTFTESPATIVRVGPPTFSSGGDVAPETANRVESFIGPPTFISGLDVAPETSNRVESFSSPQTFSSGASPRTLDHPHGDNYILNHNDKPTINKNLRYKRNTLKDGFYLYDSIIVKNPDSVPTEIVADTDDYYPDTVAADYDTVDYNTDTGVDPTGYKQKTAATEAAAAASDRETVAASGRGTAAESAAAEIFETNPVIYRNIDTLTPFYKVARSRTRSLKMPDTEFTKGRMYGFLNYTIRNLEINFFKNDFLLDGRLGVKYTRNTTRQRMIVTFSKARKLTYEICPANIRSGGRSIILPCGNYYAFAGDSYTLLPDRLPCSWRFRQMAPNFVLNLGKTIVKDAMSLQLETREVHNSYAFTKLPPAEPSTFIDYSVNVDGGQSLSGFDAEICIPNKLMEKFTDRMEPPITDYETFDYKCCKSVSHDYCGFPTGNYLELRGPRVPRDRFPWQAILHIATRKATSYTICTGQLISDQWVLTQASCFKHLGFLTPDIEVRLGDSKFPRNDAKVYKATKLFLHPTRSDTHDIALVKLDTPTDNHPICLPKYRKESQGDGQLNRYILNQEKSGTIVGWTYSGVRGRRKLDRLWTRKQTVRDSDYCSLQKRQVLPPHTLCTLTFSDRTQECLNAPYLTQYPGRYYLYGLPYSQSPCSKVVMHVYTSVAHFMPWICNVTGIAMPSN